MKTVCRLNRWRWISDGHLSKSFVALFGILGAAEIAWAHDLSQGYDLPAPLWLYTLTVMAAVLASVAMVDALVWHQPARHAIALAQPRLDLGVDPSVHWLIPPIAIGSLSVGVFVVLLVISSAGDARQTSEAFPEALDVASIDQARPVRIAMPPGITFERCLTLTPDHTLFYQFQADQPLVFDIHYHVGNVRYDAVREHLVAREQRQYTPPATREYCLTWQNPSSDPVGFSWAFTTTRSDARVVLIP